MSPPSLQQSTLPPGEPGRPYIISTQDGEIIYIPLSKSATRLLVTGKESSNAFAIVSSGGSQSPPIGFHYHNEAHDVFLCLQGNINVWADDKCRTMGAGDFASVPPGTIHQYQILGPHAEFTGLIVPGGWEEFFRFIGEPYSGAQWPMNDDRNLFEVLIPKLKAAAEQFDMVPCPQHKGVEPQPWDDETDCKLPGAAKPYFLKNASGPAYEVGGMVCRPLVTRAESNGKFAIGCVEGSGLMASTSLFGDASRSLLFKDVHHAFQVVAGSVEFDLGEAGAETTRVCASELVYVPKETAFRFRVTSRFAKMYVFASGGGLVEVLCKLGKAHNSPILPEKGEEWDQSALEGLQEEFGFSISK